MWVIESNLTEGFLGMKNKSLAFTKKKIDLCPLRGPKQFELSNWADLQNYMHHGCLPDCCAHWATIRTKSN